MFGTLYCDEPEDIELIDCYVLIVTFTLLFLYFAKVCHIVVVIEVSLMWLAVGAMHVTTLAMVHPCPRIWCPCPRMLTTVINYSPYFYFTSKISLFTCF